MERTRPDAYAAFGLASPWRGRRGQGPGTARTTTGGSDGTGMDHETLTLKKRLLARVMRCEDAEMLEVAELLLERAEATSGAPSALELEAILGAVAHALRGRPGSFS